MRNSKRVWLLPCLLLLLGSAFGAVAQQASSAYEPSLDITEESFWAGNDAALVRVKTFSSTQGFQAKITADVMQPITGKPLTVFKKAGAFDYYRYLDWNPQTDRNGIILHPDEILAVYRSNHPDPHNSIPPTTYIMRLNQGLSTNLAKTLIAIRQIRSSGSKPKILMQSAFNNDPLIAGYCMKQLLSQPISPLARGSDFVRKLIVLRNDESADVSVRILASRFVNRIKTGSMLGGDEYDWAKIAITTSQRIDFYQLNDLVTETAFFPDKRQETVSFLTGLLQNSNIREDIRSAADSSLTSQPFLSPSQPDDPINQTIIASYIDLLKDKNPMFRLSAADGLKVVCNRLLASPGADILTRRAKAAIEDASKVETDSVVANRMQTLLTRMNDSRFFAQ